MIAGVRFSPMSQSEVSEMMQTSAFRYSDCALMKGCRFSEPDSSSPSMRRVKGAGKLPATSFHARSDSMMQQTCPLSSEAPRATMALLTMTGLNGGEFQSSRGSGGWTS